MITPSARIALIGFGEAGSILGEDLALRGCSVRAWDIQLADESTRARMQHRMVLARVDATGSLAEALRGAKLIISAVTASRAAEVAEVTATLIGTGQIYLDINSMAPDSLRASATAIEAAGARCIEAAFMAPLASRRLAAPLRLSGAHAAELAPALNLLGFAACADPATADADTPWAAPMEAPPVRQTVLRGELP